MPRLSGLYQLIVQARPWPLGNYLAGPFPENHSRHQFILDVATGTGYAAMAVAKDLPDGHVTGIDFSAGMLAQAVRNKHARGMDNVTFTEMDMQAMGYPDNGFDVAICAFSIFFIDDMKTQLIHMADKVKAGGTILVSTFSNDAFKPLIDLFINRLQKYGITSPNMAWRRVATKEQCILLFEQAGLQKIKCRQKTVDYYLKDASDGWYIIRNGESRGLVERLPRDDLKRFKKEHLAEVDALRSDRGIRFEMSVLYTIGENRP